MTDEAPELRAQLAVLVAQQQAEREQRADHEVRLRLLETAVVSLSALPLIVQDLEQRQRGDERYRYALPFSAFAAAAAAIASAAGTVVAIWIK